MKKTRNRLVRRHAGTVVTGVTIATVFLPSVCVRKLFYFS